MKIFDRSGVFVRVRKEIARQAFVSGLCIYLIPNKVRFSFDNPWIKPFPLTDRVCDKEGLEEPSVYFERYINEYRYYNCNKDVGYYPHYWVRESDLEIMFMKGIKNEIQKFRNQ